MTRHGVAHIYDQAKEKAGVAKPGGIHTLRHCYATGLLEAGVELHVIQRRLGHTSIRSTKLLREGNPIEQAFARIKHWMRTAQKRNIEDTWRQLGRITETFTPSECANYPQNAGYASANK